MLYKSQSSFFIIKSQLNIKMAASRLFLLGTTLIKTRNLSSSSFPLTHHLPKSFPHQTLSFNPRFFSSTATAIDATAIDTGSIIDSSRRHPWPEWVAFVDRLKRRGYFTGKTGLGSDDGDDDVEGELGEIDGLYTDMNVLKDPCLSFARDRFDLLKSLSKKDIKTVVEAGCPNLLRKAVNSGKRLRAYLELDEGEVCSGCNLRGSCDRAYVILKEDGSAARTMDIVRILLFYALDPLVLSGGEKAYGRANIEISSKKLLSELIELSEMARDPALPMPASKVTQRKDREANHTQVAFSQNTEMKRGDWMCSKCNFLNFARNSQCRECNEPGPKQVGTGARTGAGDVDVKEGDWICTECTFVNFARNIRCLKCKSKGPDRVSSNDAEMKKGDWNCPQCEFMNFSSNKNCLRCRETRPKRQLNPGEWECPSCDYLNFRRNAACLKCKCDRPKDAEQDDYEWS